MLTGTIIGHIITKTRQEFLADFEKWCQISRWEEIKAGGVPKWVKWQEKEVEEGESGADI